MDILRQAPESATPDLVHCQGNWRRFPDASSDERRLSRTQPTAVRGFRLSLGGAAQTSLEERAIGGKHQRCRKRSLKRFCLEKPVEGAKGIPLIQALARR